MLDDFWLIILTSWDLEQVEELSREAAEIEEILDAEGF
jgi:hypothetical protein